MPASSLNRGKVFIKESPSGLEILYDHHPEKQLKRKTRQNPLFPYKNIVLCPYCKKSFTGSCPKGKSGHRFPTYHCSRKHKYFGVSKSEFDEAVDNFVRRLKFRPDAFNMAETAFTLKYHEQKQCLAQASLDAHRAIAEMRTEQKAKSEAFVAATSPVLRAGLEKEIEDLEAIIKMAGGESRKIDISTEDIKRFKEFGIYFLEHLPELLLNVDNPRLQVTLFSLVFEEFPTFQELIFGTPKLTWFFELSSESASEESFAVRLTRLSWERSCYHYQEMPPGVRGS
ncbi:MAG TPA: zinc ribbon domain-containing protein [Verrucomicrobiae bacterium]|nr:zinc ribbon domain-containing protein [Verrucomicrobiae bacterium]